MKFFNAGFLLSCSSVVLLVTPPVAASAPLAQPYRILQTAQYPGSGGIDYVFADSDARRVYVPRGGEILVFDLDSLAPAGAIPNTRARGATVDPKSGHGFSSSSPVVMWDTKTLATLKTIEVKGRPDGIVLEPATGRVFVFSHTAPNVTVIDAQTGAIVGALDLGGAPEQAAADGLGLLFVDLEDKDMVAVVDARSLQVRKKYDLQKQGGTPAGLAFDAKNRRLFVLCRDPQTCVVLDADTGKIVATLPIGRGTDGGVFNPHTGEVFSSQGDGTLTVIRGSTPNDFTVTQTLATKSRAKTCTLDLKTDRLVLITTEPMPGSQPATNAPGAKKGAASGPSLLDLIVVGR
jgi:DNA-binding beta-propeller fold protein YncE